MTVQNAKALAHELTIEYMKKHPNYLVDMRDNIPKIVDDFADINKRFYDALIHNETLDKLYQ